TTVATAPYRRHKLEAAAPAEYATMALATFQQSDGPVFREQTVVVFADYLSSAPTKWTLEMPDLSGIPGFQAKWGFSGAAYDWSVYVVGGTLAGPESLPTTDGAVSRFASEASPNSNGDVLGAPRAVSGAPRGQIVKQLLAAANPNTF